MFHRKKDIYNYIILKNLKLYILLQSICLRMKVIVHMEKIRKDPVMTFLKSFPMANINI